MKSLQTIQKTSRVFQILTKIAMIFSYVWAELEEKHAQAQASLEGKTC